MFTRDAYHKGLCTAQEYYSQFVTGEVMSKVGEWLASQTHNGPLSGVFIPTPIGKWTSMAATLRSSRLDSRLAAAGEEPSMVVLVCVAKAAAAIIQRPRPTGEQNFLSDRGWVHDGR